MVGGRDPLDDEAPASSLVDGRRSALGALRRKYRALKLAAETEPLLFDSRVFSISPASGIVSIASFIFHTQLRL